MELKRTVLRGADSINVGSRSRAACLYQFYLFGIRNTVVPSCFSRSSPFKRFPMTLIRVCSTCLVVYAFFSCLYTTSFLLLCPFVSDCSTSVDLDISRLYARVLWPRQLLADALSSFSASHTTALTATTRELVLQQAAGYRDMGDFLSSLETATTDPVLYWTTVSQGESPRHGQTLQGLSTAEPDWSLDWFGMSESLFLSKSFSSSMHPMKIFPYFYKASDTFDDDDITITTLVTPNRFEVLRKLALRYEGMAHAHSLEEDYDPSFSGHDGCMRITLT